MKKEFFKKDRETIWLTSIYIIVGIFFLANLIATCGYAVDVKFSKSAYKLFLNSKFLQGGSQYWVTDGNTLVLNFFGFFGFIFVESGFIGQAKKNPNGGSARHKYVPLIVEIIGGCIGIAISIGTQYDYLLGDHGFGPGFDNELFVGKDINIPVMVLTAIVNATITIVGIYIIRTKIIVREDFIEGEYGRKVLIVGLMIGFTNFFVFILKNGGSRTYYSNMIFGDILDRIKIEHPENGKNYMNQTEYNLGFNPGKPLVENGITYKNQYYENIPYEGPGYIMNNGLGFGGHKFSGDEVPSIKKAFPSGHMSATMCVVMTLYLFYDLRNNSKKNRMLFNVGMAVGFFMLFNMAFVLMISLSHGGSDISFTCAISPLMFFASRATINKIVDKAYGSKIKK